MLSDQTLKLLTAFVDGEITPRQQEAVMRVLRASSEAREMLRQLQEDAHMLKALPRHKVEPSLVDEVLRAIADQQVQRKQPAVKTARRRWLPFLAASLAASLVIAALGTLYWTMTSNPDGVSKVNGGLVKAAIPEKKPDPRPAPPIAKPRPKKIVEPIVEEKVTPEPIKEPPVDPVLTLKFNDLQEEGEASGRLTGKLLRAKGVELDITVRNNPLAMERLKAALHSQKIDVLVDASADAALRKKDQTKQTRVEYLVYAENLTADELTKLMQELSKADTTGMESSVPSPYDKVTVKSITKDVIEQISGLLGVDPGKLEPAKSSANVKPDPIKEWERKAVVLPVSGGGQQSKEIRQFINQRRSPQAGMVPVLIKIHE